MKRNAVLQTALRFGLGAGALCLLWTLFLYWTGQNPFGPKRGMSLLIPPVAVLLSQWFVRRYYAEGPGMGKALLTGVITAVVGAGLSALSVYSLARLANPQLLQQNYTEARTILQASRKELVKDKLTKEVYEENMRLLPQAAATPQGVANHDLTRKLILSLMLSLPGAIFFRK
jgi:uncharacterized membrane protein YqaE (UPF0057 family)